MTPQKDYPLAVFRKHIYQEERKQRESGEEASTGSRSRSFALERKAKFNRKWELKII